MIGYGVGHPRLGWPTLTHIQYATHAKHCAARCCNAQETCAFEVDQILGVVFRSWQHMFIPVWDEPMCAMVHHKSSQSGMTFLWEMVKKYIEPSNCISLLCGAQRPGLSVTPLGANGHCGPKSGNHGMPNMLPACSSLVWGHASRKLHAGMPHHLYFFKRWCPSSRECTPQNRPPQPKKCKQGVGSSRLVH